MSDTAARAEWARREAIVRELGFDLNDVSDHGLMRLREGRRWRQGFIAIMPVGLFFVATSGGGATLASTGQAAGLLFEHIAGYRGFTKIATADLFVAMDDGRRLRFNGGKTFVLLCGRALAAAGIAPLR